MSAPNSALLSNNRNGESSSQRNQVIIPAQSIAMSQTVASNNRNLAVTPSPPPSNKRLPLSVWVGIVCFFLVCVVDIVFRLTNIRSIDDKEGLSHMLDLYAGEKDINFWKRLEIAFIMDYKYDWRMSGLIIFSPLCLSILFLICSFLCLLKTNYKSVDAYNRRTKSNKKKICCFTCKRRSRYEVYFYACFFQILQICYYIFFASENIAKMCIWPIHMLDAANGYSCSIDQLPTWENPITAVVLLCSSNIPDEVELLNKITFDKTVIDCNTFDLNKPHEFHYRSFPGDRWSYAYPFLISIVRTLLLLWATGYFSKEIHDVNPTPVTNSISNRNHARVINNVLDVDNVSQSNVKNNDQDLNQNLPNSNTNRAGNLGRVTVPLLQSIENQSTMESNMVKSDDVKTSTTVATPTENDTVSKTSGIIQTTTSTSSDDQISVTILQNALMLSAAEKK